MISLQPLFFIILINLILLISKTNSRDLQRCPPPQKGRITTTTNLKPSLYNITLQDLPPPKTNGTFTPNLPNLVSYTNNLTLNAPDDFVVNIYAENLINPRWLALTPDGNVLVALTNQSKILLLKDTNQDGVVDYNTTFLDSSNGINETFGMVFTSDSFYAANPNGILRYPYTLGQDRITEAPEKIADLPVQNEGTRTLALSPDGLTLYVTVGASTETTNDKPYLGTVVSMDLDGSNQAIFASGLRDPKGLAFHPTSGELYTGVAERDNLGDEVPPDYFTRIREGEYFGWPLTYVSPDNLDPRQINNKTKKSVDPGLAATTVVPDVLVEAHTTPMGITFYTGKSFPEGYKNGAFMALHGSSGLSEAKGYKIVFIPFGDDGRPTDGYYDFITGFLLNAKTVDVWGRPAGMLLLPDGSLLFTDDWSGRIFRVQYVFNPACPS